LEHFEKALSILRQRLKEHINDRDTMETIASVLCNIGSVYDKQGNKEFHDRIAGWVNTTKLTQ